MTASDREILDRLIKTLQTHAGSGLCVAFSGGVDSSLLLKAACMAAKTYKRSAPNHNFPPVLAVTFHTALHPFRDLEESKAIAQGLKVRHEIITVDEFSDPRITNNTLKRCYYCKHLLFQTLLDFARKNHCRYIMDGTNYDDQTAYRPGREAIKELGIHSPLMELGITKAQIRNLARELGLPSSNKPSAPCLATRLPYDTPFNQTLLERIDAGEVFLRELGFYNVRLRIHGSIARIEIDQTDFQKFLCSRDLIIPYLKGLGFLYLTLDLEGFRSGSMDLTHNCK